MTETPMTLKNWHLIVFDRAIGCKEYAFSEMVGKVIEKLRLVYFRNCSLKLSEHTLLIITEKDILDSYPNIESWIDDIMCDLSEKDLRFLDFKYELFFLTPDEKLKTRIKNKYSEEKHYMLA
jgi:hypothetical protein